MNRTLLALYSIFLSFTAFTVYSLAVSEQPFLEWARGLVSVPATAQVVIDLYIACGLILVWMLHDIRKRDKPLLQWAIFATITLFSASIGPLLYLIIREHQSQAKGETEV